jgi:hypothetical protein
VTRRNGGCSWTRTADALIDTRSSRKGDDAPGAHMLPYVVTLSIAWTIFFVAWYLIGIPLGPGSPVHV